jgi:hypothetical protein
MVSQERCAGTQTERYYGWDKPKRTRITKELAVHPYDICAQSMLYEIPGLLRGGSGLTLEVERNIGDPYSGCQHQHSLISVPNRNASNINENLIRENCCCCVIVDDDVRAKNNQ